MVDLNFCSKTPDRSRDLADRDEVASIEHFGSGEEQNGASLAADWG